MKFIVDHNVGKLARWLRMMGYDALFFNGEDDSRMVVIALKQDRIILTRDTQIMKRGLVASGRVKAILLKSDNPDLQMRQLTEELKLHCHSRPFTLCLECNAPLVERTKEEVAGRVPPYVFKTQDKYMECPVCHRLYWRGTHWQAMTRTLNRFGHERPQESVS